MSVEQELKGQAPTQAPPNNSKLFKIEPNNSKLFGPVTNHPKLLGLRPRLHSPR